MALNLLEYAKWVLLLSILFLGVIYLMGLLVELAAEHIPMPITFTACLIITWLTIFTPFNRKPKKRR